MTQVFATNVAGNRRIEALVFSTANDAQDYSARMTTTGASGAAIHDAEHGPATQDDDADITVKCTGEATGNNDIVQGGLFIEAFD